MALYREPEYCPFCGELIKGVYENHICSEKVKSDINTIPRRARLDKMTQAELAISNAIMEVEKVGASVRLTEAVILLLKARDLVADHIDGTGKII